MQHIKSALTGRVAHNHCVVKALQTDLDIELLEFICKVHLIAKKKSVQVTVVCGWKLGL